MAAVRTKSVSFRGDHLDRFRPELDLPRFKSAKVRRSHGSSVHRVPYSPPDLKPMLVHILVYNVEKSLTQRPLEISDFLLRELRVPCVSVYGSDLNKTRGPKHCLCLDGGYHMETVLRQFDKSLPVRRGVRILSSEPIAGGEYASGLQALSAPRRTSPPCP